MRFAGSNLVSNFFVQHDADGRVDGIFFALAAAAENHTGRADLLALNGCNVAGPRTGDFRGVLRLRQMLGVVDNAGVAALQFDHLAKFFESLAGRD